MSGYAVVSTNYPLDGSDFPTIEEAITAGAQGIYVKAGVYATTSSITVPAETTILGESRGAIIDFEGGAFGFVLNGNDIVIDNLAVTASLNDLAAFVFDSCINVAVERCKVTASTRAAIFAGATFCTFRECWCVGQIAEQVLVSSTSTDNRILDNRFTDGTSYGISLEGAYNKVQGNTLAGHTNDGILVASGFNSILGNTCNQNANGIYVALPLGDHNSIVGNTCYANDGYGINVNSLENAGNVLTGNNCYANGVADIRIVPGNLQSCNDAATIV